MIGTAKHQFNIFVNMALIPVIDQTIKYTLFVLKQSSFKVKM